MQQNHALLLTFVQIVNVLNTLLKDIHLKLKLFLSDLTLIFPVDALLDLPNPSPAPDNVSYDEYYSLRPIS